MGKGKKKNKDQGAVDQAVALVDASSGKSDKPGKGDGKKAESKKAEGKKLHKGFDALTKLAEHPLISELLAVGAIAAVGVIAEHKKLGEVEANSAKAVKSAGKAAATAIGARLLKEFSFGGGSAKKG